MSPLLTIPHELLAEIASHLDALGTARLQATCRSLCGDLAAHMLRHATAPKHTLHALHWAADRGHLPLLHRLLGIFPIELRDSSGDPALFYASRGSAATEAVAEATVRLLLAHGANPNGGSGEQECACAPLVAALHARLDAVGRILLEAGADPNCVSGNRAPLLVCAAERGYAGWIEMLLAHGADVGRTGRDGVPVLMVAAQHGPVDSVRMLVAHGADVGYVNDHGDNVLLQAILYGHEDVALYLVRLPGVDLVSANVFRLSPLLMATSAGFHTLVSVLLQRGCPMDGVDMLSRTAMEIAQRKGWEIVERILVEEAARRETVDAGGNNVLLSET